MVDHGQPWSSDHHFRLGIVSVRLYGSKIFLHYASMSVQDTANFNGCKNDNFQFTILDFFPIFAQNIDRGYTLELPQ